MPETAPIESECGVRGFTRDDGITIRLWRPGDTPAINRFYNDPLIRPGAGHRSSRPRSDLQWEWEFALGGRVTPAYAIAEKDKCIIGTQAYIPIPMCINGRVELTGKDEDTLVHPEFRGRGVLDDLYRLVIERARLDRVAMLWGFTNTAVRPLERNGFKSIGTFDAMAVELSTIDAAGRRSDDASLRIEELSNSDDRFDHYAYRLGESADGLGLYLNREFLQWRVFDNPFREFSVLAATVDEDLVGVGIFKYEPERGCGYVSHISTVNGGSRARSETQMALLREGLRRFHERGLALAEARSSGGHPCNLELRKLFALLGFKPILAKCPLEFLVRPVLEDSCAILNASNWRICELMREY